MTNSYIKKKSYCYKLQINKITRNYFGRAGERRLSLLFTKVSIFEEAVSKINLHKEIKIRLNFYHTRKSYTDIFFKTIKKKTATICVLSRIHTQRLIRNTKLYSLTSLNIRNEERLYWRLEIWCFLECDIVICDMTELVESVMDRERGVEME